jgi:hypothetical protein
LTLPLSDILNKVGEATLNTVVALYTLQLSLRSCFKEVSKALYSAFDKSVTQREKSRFLRRRRDAPSSSRMTRLPSARKAFVGFMLR